MTTATSVLDPTAAPLLDVPEDRVCEFYDRDIIPCEQPATWALTFDEICGCNDHPRALLLACDECRRQVEADYQAAQCLECLRYLPLLRAEAL